MSEPPKPPSEEKKVDPGWNDPPMLNYSPSNPPPKSRITNKRVPFPISGTPSANTATEKTNTPFDTSQGPPKN